jgi:hypothetical protein
MRTAALASFVLLGCVADRGPAPEAVADVKQVMTAILEPAADVYWDAAGTIIDTLGVRDLAPTTDDEWLAVSNAALMIAESGNLLMLEGRARDRGRWMRLSRALVATGRTAMTAAASRDPAAVLDAGGQVYEACTACHAAYALETLRPSDARQGSKTP